MKPVSQIRHENLLALIDEVGGASALAERMDVSPAYVSQLRNSAADSKTGRPRQIGDRTARRLEESCGKPTGWMDTPRPEVNAPASFPVSGANVRRIYVVGRGSGGALPERIWGDGDYPVGATDAFGELASSDPHAFLSEVVGFSMVPRYNPGEFALVEPGTEPDIEDDVLVRLESGETLLKRLLSRRGGLKLGSYNDSEVRFFEPASITWVYYVAHPVPRRKIKTRM